MVYVFNRAESNRSRASTSSSDEPLSKKLRIDIEDSSEASGSLQLDEVSVTSTNRTTLPTQSLLKATVMLEYGEKLEKNATIHIDCLTAQSNMMKNIFEEAKPIKQAYANVKIIRREVKALLSPMMSKDDYLRKDVDENFAKSLSLINECYERFPLVKYQKSIQKNLRERVDELFQDKNTWSETKLIRKDYPAQLILERLQKMTAPAVLTVLTFLCQLLWQVKLGEKDEVRTSKINAAALGRVILGDVEEKTVLALTTYIYKGTLQLDSADDLCKIHALTEQLGLDDLAETCLEKLANATREVIEIAAARGMSLQEVLNMTRSAVTDSSHDEVHDLHPFFDVVSVVFSFVLKNKTPPDVLKRIVLEAIADSGDVALTEMALEMMNGSKLTSELCVAVTDRFSKLRESRSESSTPCTKPENQNLVAETKMKEEGEPTEHES